MIDLVQLHGLTTDPGVWSTLTDSQRVLAIMDLNHGVLVKRSHASDVELSYSGASDCIAIIPQKVLKDLLERSMIKRLPKLVDHRTNYSQVIYVITQRGVKANESVVAAMKLVEELKHS